MNGPVAKPVLLAGSTSIVVGAAATVYTDAIKLDNLDTFALAYKLAGAAGVSAKIEMEQSIVAPTANAADVNSVVPETVADIVTAVVDKLLHLQAIFPVSAKYIRFKITENGVAADMTLAMSLSIQNRFET